MSSQQCRRSDLSGAAVAVLEAQIIKTAAHCHSASGMARPGDTVTCHHDICCQMLFAFVLDF